MNLVLLIGFNNYFNRKIIYYSTTDVYEDNCEDFRERTFINFNPNDGVTTELVVEWDSTQTPDYLLVLDEKDESIVSRWFIKEFVRLREGQYKATLRRDVIADHFNSVIKSPCFIERGPLPPSNKLIYNSEGMTFNQVKWLEKPLKDETENAWIVGYLTRDPDMPLEEIPSIFNADTYPTPESLGIVLNNPADITQGGTITSMATNAVGALSYIFYNAYTSNYSMQFFVDFDLDSMAGITQGYKRAASGAGSRGTVYNKIGRSDADTLSYISDKWTKSYLHNPTARAALITAFRQYISTVTAPVESYNRVSVNPIIQYGADYYSVNVTSTVVNEVNVNVTPSGGGAAMYAALNNLYDYMLANYSMSDYIVRTNEITQPAYGIKYTRGVKTLTFTKVTPPGVSRTTLKAYGARNSLDDAPYDMFCLKYNLSNLGLAQSIAQKLGGTNSFLVDLQILPYCPARYIIDNRVLSSGDYSSIVQKSAITGRDVEVDKLYYCKHSSDTFMIELPISVDSVTGDEAIDIKLSNELEMYRLTSPNYASSFEFSVAKNGNIRDWKVSYTYRPISPYIHVQPLFANLYGNWNNDARGLICQGDFSVDVMTDAFTNYQIQNKNYENIFNTQIKKLDDSHNISQKYAGINAGVNAAFSAAAAGAMGALGGAIANRVGVARGIDTAGGLASSLIGIAQAEEQYKVNRQYEVDMYNYQLGNVAALPDTLTKVSAYNIDNNYFPIVEYYGATGDEYQMLKEKIKYQGFKIMSIMKIEDLLPYRTTSNYIKGQMIRLEDFYEDNHMAEEIYSEIMKGVYI